MKDILIIFGLLFIGYLFGAGLTFFLGILFGLELI